MNLKKTIESTFDDVTVLDIIPGVQDAIKWFEENSEPDIIFSDIHLSDGLSFEIYKNINIKAPIIFCTAYDEYAIEAFKTSGIDYLLKPINDEKLTQSIEKYKSLKENFTASNHNNAVNALLKELDTPEFKKNILVNFQEKIIPVKTENIAYVHYEMGMLYMVTFESKKYYLNQTLDELEVYLDNRIFFRANRQFIVNKSAILNIENYFTRRLKVVLTMPVSEQIIISKAKSSQFLKWIENV